MKVLFAVSSESISEAIVKKYQKDYKEILSYKNVYYFNAILKEIQKDKTYDRIVISEDLESFSNNNYDAIDKFIFEKLDDISDEAQDIDGNETSIILICTDRHTKGSSFLVKLFGIGIYNALLGSERSMEQVCKLINKPRVKKEAKMYYKIDADEVNYANKSSEEVSELEIQNILTHFKKLGRNTNKFADSFNNIASQYTDDQLKIIINCLPASVKVVLEDDCQKYQELMDSSGVKKVNREGVVNQEARKQAGIKIDIIENKINSNKMSGPIVIPSSVRTSKNKGPAPVRPMGNSLEVPTEAKTTTVPTKKVVRKSDGQVISVPNVQAKPAAKVASAAEPGKVVKKVEKTDEVVTKKTVAKVAPQTVKKEQVPPINLSKKSPGGIDPRLEALNKAKAEAELSGEKKGRGRPKKSDPAEETVEELDEFILPGMDAFEDDMVLPGMEEDTVEETVDTLPGMDDTLEEDDDLVLPGMDAFEEDDDDLVLPGMDDTTSDEEDDFLLPDADEEDEDLLPGMEEDTVEEDEDLLPGMEEDAVEDDEDLLPGMDDDVVEDEDDFVLPSLDDEFDEDDDTLPGMVDDFEDDDTGIPLVSEEFEEVDDFETVDEIEEVDEVEEAEEYTEEVSLPGLDELDDFEDDSSDTSIDEILPGTSDDVADEEDLLSGFEDDDFASVSEPQTTTQQVNQTTEIESIKPRVDYSMSSLNSLLTKDKKIVTFIGTSKNGTSFLINNLAALFSSLGINTAILDMTKNKNSYYIYTNNEEELRNIAYSSISKLQNGGYAEGIKVGKNLSVYTALPNDGKDYSDAEPILSTLVQNHSLILIDCDFDTDPSYFASCQEIYLVQSMDILTIQPLTAFLRDLKSKGVLEAEKVRVVINKELKVRSLTAKAIIGGMSFYNDPSMSFMTELFNKDMVKACSIPFDESAYSKYLDAMANCNVSINGYSKQFMSKLRNLGEMVYPLVGKSTYGKTVSQTNYGKNNFSNNMNNTLNQMKKKY